MCTSVRNWQTRTMPVKTLSLPLDPMADGGLSCRDHWWDGVWLHYPWSTMLTVKTPSWQHWHEAAREESCLELTVVGQLRRDYWAKDIVVRYDQMYHRVDTSLDSLCVLLLSICCLCYWCSVETDWSLPRLNGPLVFDCYALVAVC